MTDEEIAREVLNDLFPDRLRATGSKRIGIPERTFLRICTGQTTIKSANWEKLRADPEFAAAFARARKADEPSLDRRTRETMGRLGALLGPRILSLAANELEAIAKLYGPEKTLSAIERLAETARDFADSKGESEFGQKSS